MCFDMKSLFERGLNRGFTVQGLCPAYIMLGSEELSGCSSFYTDNNGKEWWAVVCNDIIEIHTIISSIHILSCISVNVKKNINRAYKRESYILIKILTLQIFQKSNPKVLIWVVRNVLFIYAHVEICFVS